MGNQYRMLGLVFCVAGSTLVPISHLAIGSVPLTVLGLSVAILGVTCFTLTSRKLPVSPEACGLILRTGIQNTAVLLEELEIRGSAIYLPFAMTGGSARALIPLAASQDIVETKGKIPARLIVRYNRDPGDMAISVATAGGMTIDLLEATPGPSSSEIEAAVSHILVGALDIASSVAVKLTDHLVNVGVSSSQLHYEDVWDHRCLGISR